MTFRSSFAAYMNMDDKLSGGCGVVNPGGFRNGCYSSMIPANGLLVSTNSGSGGCTCAYPISTALAMFHLPEAEEWGSFGARAAKPVRRLGINFGAPGDHLSDDGTLWLDYPGVGGPSPQITLQTNPKSPEWFRRHSSRVTEGEGFNWVHASGAKNLDSVTVELGNDKPRSYTLRIYYAEPIDGQIGSLRGSVEQRRGVRAGKTLTCKFKPGKWVCGLQLVDESLSKN